MQLKLNIFFKTLALFALTQFLGFYVAIKIIPEFTGQSMSDSFGAFSLGDFIYLAVIVFLFFFFSIKFQRVGAVIYKIILSLIIFVSFQNLLDIWINSTISLLVALIVLWLFWFRRSVIIQNLAMVVVIAIIGAVFGLSLKPVVAVYALIIFSVYDIIAVYLTGHMVKMAEVMVKSKAIFGFVIPNSMRDYKVDIKAVQPGENFMILGSGDVIFPLILIASLVPISVSRALIVLIFSFLGLLATHLIFVNQKIRRPMAALPPIAALTIIGYLISTLIK